MSAAAGVALGVVGGAIRISTPFLFVSLGECLTEKSGRVNLGLEGTLVMGAMAAYGVSYLTGSPWLGVLTAGVAGLALGALHAFLCARPRVNDVARVRLLATMAGGFLAGVGGSFLSLFYPGSWNEGLSSGQGLMAVALVIFARWDPLRCLAASLLFGGASALGPALQSVGVTSGYYLFNAAPYALTLAIIIATSSRDRALTGQPAELRVAK